MLAMMVAMQGDGVPRLESAPLLLACPRPHLTHASIASPSFHSLACRATAASAWATRPWLCSRAGQMSRPCYRRLRQRRALAASWACTLEVSRAVAVGSLGMPCLAF